MSLLQHGIWVALAVFLFWALRRERLKRRAQQEERSVKRETGFVPSEPEVAKENQQSAVQDEGMPPVLRRSTECKLNAPWDQLTFALKLFRQLKHCAPHQNVFFSPAGLAVSLLLLHNGARGETRREIARFLGVNNLSETELGSAVGNLVKEVNAISGRELELELANSLWVHEQADLLSEFERDAHAHFEAELERANFRSERTLERMNAWIIKKTRGKLSASEGNIEPAAWISILNAAYLKGSWLVPFDPKETKQEVFMRSDGTRRIVPMMYRKDYFFFVRGEGFQGVSLPYRGNRFHMLVLLPEQSLDEFIQHLYPKVWDTQRHHFSHGPVKMPRFLLKCEARLEESPAKRELTRIFNPRRADFSGIVRPPARPYISGIRHSATCEVNELGTVAAAFTDLKLIGFSALMLNRPFLFAIQEFQTKFILFLGAVEDPEQAG